MIEVKKYRLPPTPLVPNSPNPLLHYPSFFTESACDPVNVYNIFHDNGWELQWIGRYGPTQTSHYHSRTHECMAVLSGTATIRFGVADIQRGADEVKPDDDNHGQESGGIEVHASIGDVFVIPAGVAHKTFRAQPVAESRFLTSGDGHQQMDPSKRRRDLAEIELSGFTMLGAYPVDGNEWDFALGGDHIGQYEEVWSVPKPDSDPVLGKDLNGVVGQWK